MPDDHRQAPSNGKHSPARERLTNKTEFNICSPAIAPVESELLDDDLEAAAASSLAGVLLLPFEDTELLPPGKTALLADVEEDDEDRVGREVEVVA